MNNATRFILMLLGVALLAACGKRASEERVVNVYNWSDYITQEVLDDFTKETGVKVNYDTFDSNEMLETKLLAGHSGYDVVVPSASFLERQIKAGVFRKLDKSKLTNFKNLDPDIMRRIAVHDPGNEHAVNYMWGTTGIGYNTAKVAQADSWSSVLDPANAAKFKDCGIAILDDPTEVTGIVLKFLGRDPNSESPSDLQLAEEALMNIRPYVRYVHSSRYIEDLANGEICVAVGYNGDILQARDRAAQAGRGVTVAYTIPKEGTVNWFDMLAIPADAPHPGEAHLFIDYLLRSQVAAAISNYRKYANGNAAAFPLVDESIRNDPGIYPPPEVMVRLFPDKAKSAEFTRLLNRSWTRFRTGQ